ncbi:MAG: hypothetical protein GYA24_13285 [Candidatus Lokiarchaeota archaeon]|nr:hypothetical protein [Candidatus Lokiarchaeota archaeon]
MKAIVVTTFDSIKGPIVHFMVTDGFMNERIKEDISSMINFKAPKDYFIVRVGGITAYNLEFTIKSGISRGNVEILMLSFVTDAFPSKKVESYFLRESASFIAYLQREPLADLVFHLQDDFSSEEYAVIERIYTASLDRLQAMLHGYP